MMHKPPDLFDRAKDKRSLRGGGREQWGKLLVAAAVLAGMPWLLYAWGATDITPNSDAQASKTVSNSSSNTSSTGTSRSIRNHGFGGRSQSSGRSFFGGGSSIH